MKHSRFLFFWFTPRRPERTHYGTLVINLCHSCGSQRCKMSGQKLDLRVALAYHSPQKALCLQRATYTWVFLPASLAKTSTRMLTHSAKLCYITHDARFGVRVLPNAKTLLLMHGLKDSQLDSDMSYSTITKSDA